MNSIAGTAGRQPTALDAMARSAFAAIARMRGDNALHPLGRAHRAILTIDVDRSRLPSVAVLQETSPATVIVRLSRGAGLPSPLPDALGLAIRWPDRYGPGKNQDLLMTSSLDMPLANHVPIPQLTFRGATLSTLLPYELAGRRLLFGARIEDARGLESRTDFTGLRLSLMLGERFGRFHPFATIVLKEALPPRMDAQLHFDPWNTAEDVTPAGWLNRLRGPAYAGSRRTQGESD